MVFNQRIGLKGRFGLSARTERGSGDKDPTPTERTVFLRLSPDGSRADLPRYPYRAYYSVLSIPRPCAALLQAAPVPHLRAVNADKRYPRVPPLLTLPDADRPVQRLKLTIIVQTTSEERRKSLTL